MKSLFHILRVGLIVGLFMGFVTAPALAKDGHWYTALKGGINGGAMGEASGQGLSVDLDTQMGAALVWSVGYAVNGIRIESELSWRRNDLDSVTLPGNLRFQSTGTNTAPAEGRLLNFAYMVNGVYEMNLTPLFTPFLLGGVGFSRVTGELERVGSLPFYFDDDKTAFAYQVGAGLEYPLIKDLSFEVSYRFFGTPAVEFDDVEVNNTHHTGLFGLTLAF